MDFKHKIIQWNCRGLKPNYNEVSLLISGYNPSVFCFQETFLKPDDNISLKGFNVYNYVHTDCLRPSGGASIFVKSSFPQWEKEKKILKIKCENNLSFPDARKQYEQFYTGQTYASAVKPGTCNKSTQTENKTTQTDDSFDEYLKKQEKSQSEKTPKETPKGKQDKNTSSPRPGPALY